MARSTLTATALSSAGVQPTPAAANADGYRLQNDGRIFLLVENTNGASAGADIVVATSITRDGLALPDRTITIAGTETHLIGPFSPDVYNRRVDTDPGFVYIDFGGAVADLQVQAFRIP